MRFHITTASPTLFEAFQYACHIKPGFMFGATDVAHLSIIPVIAKDQDEAMFLNSFR